MGGSGFLLLFVVAATVFIVVGVLGAWQASERRKRLARWAAGRGLTFDASHEPGFDDRYPRFDCLRRGSGRYAHNRMWGERGGRGVVCFDYRYQTSSTNGKGGSSTHTHRFSGVLVRLRSALPGLTVGPEGMFDRIGAFFGFDDIDFESAQFSRRFKVTSEDRRWAYDVIHPAMMEFMLARPVYSIQIAGDVMLLINGDRWNAAEFDAALGYAEAFLDLIPAGVLAERR